MIIGLTIIAFGTNAPELLVSLVSSSQGANDLALGNIFGSNIFNIFFILGRISLINPIPITGQNLADIIVLLISTLFMFMMIFIFTAHRVGKSEGFLMLTLYLAYLYYIFIR